MKYLNISVAKINQFTEHLEKTKRQLCARCCFAMHSWRKDCATSVTSKEEAVTYYFS